MVGIKAILEFMAAHPFFAQLSFVGTRQMGPPELRTAYEAGIRMLSAMFDRRARELMGERGDS
ncbi:MAG TPA: hypothetical protein VF030_10955 [Solirubrobacterales bacterium]